MSDEETSAKTTEDTGEKKHPILKFGIFAGSLIVAGVIGGVVNKYFESKPHLTVAVQDVLPLNLETVPVYFKVINDGSKEARDVACTLDLKDCEITEVKTDPPALNPVVDDSQKAKGKLSVKVALLNPTESLQVAVAVKNADKVPRQPNVEVRADGVRGEKQKPPRDSTLAVLTIIFSIGTLSFFVAWFRDELKVIRKDAQIRTLEWRLDTAKREHERAIEHLKWEYNFNKQIDDLKE